VGHDTTHDGRIPKHIVPMGRTHVSCNGVRIFNIDAEASADALLDDVFVLCRAGGDQADGLQHVWWQIVRIEIVDLGWLHGALRAERR
jgi:hypothetical protein